MLRCCSYCQNFMGQTPPFENYCLTHSICETCRPAIRTNTMDMDRARSRSELFHDLWDQARAFNHRAIPELLKRAVQLGLKNSDLLFGMAAPQLREIGRMFEGGILSVEAEHEFTAFMEAAIHCCQVAVIQEEPPKDQTGGVLLACADGNYHTLGVRMLRIALAERGVLTRVQYPSLPLGDMRNLIERYQPAVIGVSLGLPAQIVWLQALKHTIDLMVREGGLPSPVLVAGGSGWIRASHSVKDIVTIDWNLPDYEKMICQIYEIVAASGRSASISLENAA